MRTNDFNYPLPEALIAQRPAEPRDSSRLLVLDRRTGGIQHKVFRDLPECLRPDDCLVLNDTRVRRARLQGKKLPTGGSVEFFLLRPAGASVWECLVRPAKRLRAGAKAVFRGGLTGTIIEELEGGRRLVEWVPHGGGGLGAALEGAGDVPLPPYIRAALPDGERYQTIYARTEGSAAAPTAGLHFTAATFRSLADRGVRTAQLTLHIGLDTFRPVETEAVEDHTIHSESYTVSEETAACLNQAREAGGRLVAVGTTCVRTLETIVDADGRFQAGSGWTSLFIYPGHAFRAVDAMVTNFHLPRSSLLMLVSAFAGREKVQAAYATAVAEGYRFYSFGDAMFIH